MSTRLAFGMTTGPGLRCWLPTPGGTPMPADDRAGAHPPGAPVAVGPADATPEPAIDQLTVLVAGGTEVAAGAGVDLGHGFTSARLAGAPGDRRDAVLAALRFLSMQNADRLGDRGAVLVSLFGLSATKRVGAAANEAIAEERWAALQLASAVSDLLGPEQLEQVLGLRAPEGTDPFPRGAASTLADHLSRVLTRYQRPRRLALITSLWQQVCAQLLNRQRLARLPTTQTTADHLERLRERHQQHFDEPIVRMVTRAAIGTPTLASAARWRPPSYWPAKELGRLLHDAIAATALLRFARTMSDEGLPTAARRHRDELVAANACLTKAERSAAAWRSKEAYEHPARPGRYVHDLLQPLRPDRGITRNTETYVQERVGLARNYGVVVLDAISELLERENGQPLHDSWDNCKPWQATRLRAWRAATGFRRSPNGWEQPPLPDAHAEGPKETLAQRLTEAPAADPATLETPHDLLWYADLADALAPFYGNETATVRHARPGPELSYNPPAPRPEPNEDSVPLAAAATAQLVAFGASPPQRCRSWAELAEGVSSDATVAEASTGTFPIPPELSNVDKETVPETALRIELGRDPRQLAEWSSYMGNCIGESWYADQAHKGQCVLMALRDDDRIVANLDIRRRTSGWQVHELRARFNDTVAPELEEQVGRWVRSLTPKPPTPEPAPPEPRVRSRDGASHRSTDGRLPTALVRALTAEVDRTLAESRTTTARQTYATLARGLAPHADFDPTAAVVALKRLDPTEHVDLLRRALATDLDVPALWRATGVRPLAAAVARLDPAVQEHDRLTTLTEEAPLPRTLRALVRRPEIAPAYAMDVAARATRRAMGKLAGDDTLARAVARHPSPELVCALIIRTTCAPTANSAPLTPPGTTSVPGFPTTDLLDEQGPWQQALPAAADLGAQVESFNQHLSEHGLLAPAALLRKDGWPALWQRAHR